MYSMVPNNCASRLLIFQNFPNQYLAVYMSQLGVAVTEMVPELIWAPDFFGPQEN